MGLRRAPQFIQACPAFHTRSPQTGNLPILSLQCHARLRVDRVWGEEEGEVGRRESRDHTVHRARPGVQRD